MAKSIEAQLLEDIDKSDLRSIEKYLPNFEHLFDDGVL